MMDVKELEIFWFPFDSRESNKRGNGAMELLESGVVYIYVFCFTLQKFCTLRKEKN